MHKKMLTVEYLREEYVRDNYLAVIGMWYKDRKIYPIRLTIFDSYCTNIVKVNNDSV